MTRPIGLSDWTRFRAAGGAKASPDGKYVVFSVTSSDLEQNRNQSQLWLYDAQAESDRVLTEGPNDHGAVWDSSGRRIAYIGKDNEGGSAIYVLDVGSGTARLLASGLDSPASLTWVPEADALTFLAYALEPESEVSDLADAVGEDLFGRQKETGLRLTARYPFRFDDIGYYDARRKHLFRVSLSDAAPTPDQMTRGEFDVAAYDWHPGGQVLVFASLTDQSDIHCHTLFQLVLGQEPRPLIDLKGEITGIRWSPDGKYLAWVGDDNSYGWGAENQLWLADPEGREIRNLTAMLDRQVGEVSHGDVKAEELSAVPVWSDDSTQVYVEYNDEGVGRILGADVRNGMVRPVLPKDWDGTARNPDLAHDILYFCAENFTSPTELYAVSRTSGRVRQLTNLNGAILDQLNLGGFERVCVERAGFSIWGWLGKPPEYSAGKTYPLLMYVHGGPHGAFGAVFRHEFHTEMARGRLVLFVNPRGSQGYGQQFAAACMRDWGGEDFQDLMAVLDHVLALYPVDPAKMGVTGISYGGYMTNWIITHSGRFGAAISEMSVSNHLSMYTHSDIGVNFMYSEFGAEPWQHWERLWERSPIRYAKVVVTPTLFIAGAEDHRCPPEQTEAMYVALLQRQIPTAYVRFPNAAHGFSRSGPPEQRLERRRLMARWWDRYLS